MRKLIWFLPALALANECIAASPVGQEKLYEGKAMFEAMAKVFWGLVSTHPSNWQVSVREVTIEPEGKGFRCLSFRIIDSKGDKGGDVLQFVTLPKSRLILGLNPLPPLESPRLPFLPFSLTLFTPTLSKVGQTWTNPKEFVWWSSLGFKGFALPVRYQVVAKEKLNGQTCWVVERKVPKQYGQISFERYRERWWLAKSDGTTMQYVLDIQLNQALPLCGNYSMTLQLTLRLKRTGVLSQEVLSHLRQTMQNLQGLDEELRKMEQKPANENIASWEQIFAQVQSWLEAEKDEWIKRCILIPARQKLTERRSVFLEKLRLLVEAQVLKGQYPPAQDFTLQDTDGKTHRLSDYKSKIVVLSFFGLG